MAGVTPMAFYGVTVPSGDIMVPALKDFPASFRITMAAIDPSAEPETEDGVTTVPRATLKIIRDPLGADYDDEDGDDDDDDDDSDASFDEAQMNAILGEDDDDDEDEDDEDSEVEDEEGVNGGPSDPAKSKKARKAAAVKQLVEDLKAQVNGDEDMEVDGVNGIVKKSKGKARALDDEDMIEDDDSDIVELEEFVLCTLDPAQNYQQTLDITVGEHEQVYFKVSGTHDVHITGNYIADPMAQAFDDDSDSDDEDEYDLSPGEEELDDEDEEEDELDNIDDPRIMELEEDEEEVPVLVTTSKKEEKGKNKRVADTSVEDLAEDGADLDNIIAKSIKPDTNGEKLTKSQKKKLKNNAGEATAAPETKAEEKPTKSDKKVQFAKNLEQGPTASTKTEAAKPAINGEKKASLGVKVLLGGVKIDDKKLGTGPAAKSGNRVSMRYIGKLEKDGKVFDANKKGKPFSFKLGAGEVIKGWDIGVAGMSVGAERRITIPAAQGYGSKGQKGIPPNSNLVFDVKMLEIK